MSTAPIPTHPIVLRRQYIEYANKVATRQPTEDDLARLLALTQALFRLLTGEANLTINLEFPEASK